MLKTWTAIHTWILTLTVVAVAYGAPGDHGNLLVNPGMEVAEPFRWAGSVATVQRVQGVARSGRSSLQIIDQSDSQGQANSELFPVTPGRYFAEAWVQQDPSLSIDTEHSAGITFGVQFFDSDRSYISSADLTTVKATTWTRVGGMVTVPDGAALVSIRIRPTSADAAAPAGYNLGRAKAACFVDDLYFAPLDLAAQDGRLKPRRAAEPLHEAGRLDDGLVLHYRFDRDSGQTATDLSGFGNGGHIIEGEFLSAFQGRRGVLRLNGETAYIDCGDSESLQFTGDVTLEMWVRFNQSLNEPSSKWHVIFGAHGSDKFKFMMPYGHTLAVLYRNLEDGGLQWLPVNADFIDERWAHIAVVVEYPRCRFYRNGKLYHDAYMPFPGVKVEGDRSHQIGGSPDGETYAAPIDLTEFRLYRRALSAKEIMSHARGREMSPPQTSELAVEPDWYNNIVNLRYVAKGGRLSGEPVSFAISRAGSSVVAASAETTLAEAFPGAGRYVATVAIPMASLSGTTFVAKAQNATQRFTLEKPEWIHSQAGISVEVLAPWTPVTTQQAANGSVDVGVWGRQYTFDQSSLVRQITSGDAAILSAPIAFKARADGEAMDWQGAPAKLLRSSDTAATIEQVRQHEAANLHVASVVEYDGFITIDCELKANRDLSLDELTLEIPMQTAFATFCGGDYVLPKKPNVSMSAMYRGAVKGDLSFKFGPTVWLGNELGGLSWQADSDENWHYADAQRAIEILPRGETTFFRAHFVDVPTQLAKGEALRYRFALQGTPLKPLRRDAWSMRIARSEPYGGDLDLPDKVINGEPALQAIAKTGVRHLFINVNDEFPWPMPRRQRFKDALLRLNNAAHDAGLGIYCYAIHARIPSARPEFDLYGSRMLLQPSRQYMQAVRSLQRPGPVPWKPDMLPLPQGSSDFCQNSEALQDAYMHALNQRVTGFGDDGVYLDGTYCTEPCINARHGCGYRDKDGKVHPTYPVFATRRMMQRIYTIVHRNKPDGIVDLHSSFFFNPSSVAYADVIWTGEQWYELRFTGTDYVAGTLSLDMFRTEFTGWPLGVAAETLHYRLGSTMKVAATSLLHDISPRVSSNGYEEQGRQDPYFAMISDIWKLRDDFGIEQAEKLFYFDNQNVVTVSPEQCHATLFRHPTHGVLALISNLSRDAQEVTVQLNRDKLNLSSSELQVVRIVPERPATLATNDTLSIPLGSEEWAYVWLRPAAR